MIMDEYLSKLESIGDAIDEKSRLQNPLEFAHTLGVDEDIFHRIKELMPIATKLLTSEEVACGKLNCLRVEMIRQAPISYKEKVLMGAIYFAALNSNEDKRFLRYFEPYHKEQPAFRNTGLWKKLRDEELISLDECDLINDHVFSDGYYFRLSYYNEALIQYLEAVKGKYPVFVRVHPYVVLNERPPKELLEAVIRPIDPKWIQKLSLYPGNKTAGEYILQNPLESRPCGGTMSAEEQIAYWEYHIGQVRKLDVYAARGNNKNLHMMVEELQEKPNGRNYYLGKCIHLDTDDAIGTDYSRAVLNHIDLAINVYDKAGFETRKMQSLAHGKVVDATLRKHILRVEKVSFSHLLQLAADFLDSKTLYLKLPTPKTPYKCRHNRGQNT